MINKHSDQIVEGFLNNRQSVSDYLKMLDDSFQAYIVSDEYACMSNEGRATYKNTYLELKTLICRLIEIKAILIKADLG